MFSTFYAGFERFRQSCPVKLTCQMVDLDTSAQAIRQARSTRIGAFPKRVSPRAGLPRETCPFWVATYSPAHGPSHWPRTAVVWQSICPANRPLCIVRLMKRFRSHDPSGWTVQIKPVIPTKPPWPSLRVKVADSLHPWLETYHAEEPLGWYGQMLSGQSISSPPTLRTPPKARKLEVGLPWAICVRGDEVRA